MTGFVFASVEEARPFLKNYGRGRFDGLAEDETVQDDSILVTIIGVGKIKATLRTERLLRQQKLQRLIHAGTARALVEDLPEGTLVSVGQVFEGDRVELSAPTYPRMPLDNPFKSIVERRLVTQDHSVKEGKDLTYWQRIADITDSIGYPLAYVAATHGVPCSIVKLVTGLATVEDDPRSPAAEAAYEALSTFLMDTAVPFTRE
ncbi:MAG: 5'-methylthioadenosine nucleosidase [Bacteroidetes bacterium]|nr:5'-methylthioadenosine nucleosidase [Bacteroidota bacterium]